VTQTGGFFQMSELTTSKNVWAGLATPVAAWANKLLSVWLLICVGIHLKKEIYMKIQSDPFGDKVLFLFPPMPINAE
jgi:hypothetical protein